MKIEPKHIIWAIAILALISYSGAGNKMFLGAVEEHHYKANCETVDGNKVCETRYIDCTPGTDGDKFCQKACLGDTSYKWLSEELNMTESELYDDIQSSYCNSQNRCVVSEWCFYTGSLTDYVKEHPWAWIKENPLYALLIVVGTIIFFTMGK